MAGYEQQFFIGTSNIVLPGNRQSFPEVYQRKSRLHYYSTLFNSVELNSTFYKVPRATTFEKWSEDVLPGFKFSIKLWKAITHANELKFNAADIKHFMETAAHIGHQKGCLLIQFPGKITLGFFRRVETLLLRIKETDRHNEWPIAVEFRNASWYVAETNELLDAYKASMVLHDIPKGKNREINKDATVIYLRFHGPAGDYRGSYEKKILQEHAVTINQWLNAGKKVYAYFNNTIGNAFENAMQLKAMIK